MLMLTVVKHGIDFIFKIVFHIILEPEQIKKIVDIPSRYFHTIFAKQ